MSRAVGGAVSGWDEQDLQTVGEASEVEVTSHRPDGTLRPPVTIWAVRYGGALYVRSAHGPANGWFRRARTAGTGRVRAGGVSIDVVYEAPEKDTHDSHGAPVTYGPHGVQNLHAVLDAVYHAKYDRYGPGPVGAVTGAGMEESTLRVLPRD